MLKQVAGVHHAAFFGLEGTIALLRKRHGPDRKDTLGQTPLWLAAQKGYEAVFDDLLSLKDAVNLDSRDESSRTPLSIAAERGHESAVLLLLLKTQLTQNRRIP